MSTLIELENVPHLLISNAGKFSVFDSEANKYRTPMQRVMAIGLRPLMLWKASGKATHWFDWKELPDPEQYEGIFIPRDPNAFVIRNDNPLLERLNYIKMSLGKWTEAALIGPDPGKADVEKLKKTGWLFGFRLESDFWIPRTHEYSQILNKGYSSTLVLRGPENMTAIGLEPETLKEIPLVGMRSAPRGTAIL